MENTEPEQKAVEGEEATKKAMRILLGGLAIVILMASLIAVLLYFRLQSSSPPTSGKTLSAKISPVKTGKGRDNVSKNQASKTSGRNSSVSRSSTRNSSAR